MRAVGELFKSSAKAPIKRIHIRAILNEGQPNETVYSSDDVLVSLDIATVGNLFESAISTANLKLLGTNYDLDGQLIKLCLDLPVRGFELLAENSNVLLTESGEEIWTGDHPETIDYGLFVVHGDETSYGKESTVLKLYSLMYLLQSTKYKEGDLSYPCTIKGLAQDIADKFGFELSDIDHLPNVNYTIQEDLYAKIHDITYRDILAEIAGATATMAVIDDVNKIIYFRPPQTSVQEELTYDNLKTANIGDSYGPVNSLVLARIPQEDNIVLADQPSINLNGLTEVKLANNEIMDDDRPYFMEGIFKVIDGIAYVGCEITTEGHGWYEVGDRIKIITDEGDIFESVITEIKLVFDGGIKETLKCVVPETSTTDYALAGSIAKTIHNTEIKVDKQGQQIVSIVEEHDQFEQIVNANFTNVTQNISSVITSVQNSGGNNLIKNSAMYAKENGVPIHWTFTGSGAYSTTPSADASANGSLSGQVIGLSNMTISQVVTVKPDDDSIAEDSKTYYSFSCRVKKISAGTASITLSDGTEEGIWTISLPNGKSSNYGEFAIEAILPHSTGLTISVTASDDAEFYITDMMLAAGNYRSQWTQANGEFSNSQVQIDIDGITVKNSNLDGSYTKQTPQEVEVYKDGRLAALVSGDKVMASSGTFSNEIDMPPIKIVPMNDGWAFVEKES